MKKILIVLLLAALALSCLVAAGIAGFYGYRHYSRRGVPTTVPPGESATASAETGSAEGQGAPTGSTSVPSDLPEVYTQTRRSGSSEDSSTAGAARVPPPREASSSGVTPSHPEAGAPPKPSPSSPPRSPTTQEQPEREGWKPKHGPSTPYPQTRRSGVPDVSEPRPPDAPKYPKGGSLGLIFESRVDRGEMVLRVDGAIVERVPFQASAENRFRFTRQVPLAPGTHSVKVRVNLPGEDPQVRDWNVTVVPGGSTVWKVTLDRFPKQLEVKNIP